MSLADGLTTPVEGDEDKTPIRSAVPPRSTSSRASASGCSC